MFVIDTMARLPGLEQKMRRCKEQLTIATWDVNRQDSKEVIAELPKVDMVLMQESRATKGDDTRRRVCCLPRLFYEEGSVQRLGPAGDCQA